MVSARLLNPDLNPTTVAWVFSWRVFGFGFLGGVAGDLLAMIESRRDGLPAYAKSAFYWLSVLGLALFGGTLAIAYGPELQTILALNVGASAPLILKSLASAVPRLSTPKID